MTLISANFRYLVKLRSKPYHRSELVDSIERGYQSCRSIEKQREREKEKESSGRCRRGRRGRGEHRVERLPPDRMAEQSGLAGPAHSVPHRHIDFVQLVACPQRVHLG